MELVCAISFRLTTSPWAGPMIFRLVPLWSGKPSAWNRRRISSRLDSLSRNLERSRVRTDGHLITSRQDSSSVLMLSITRCRSVPRCTTAIGKGFGAEEDRDRRKTLAGSARTLMIHRETRRPRTRRRRRR